MSHVTVSRVLLCIALVYIVLLCFTLLCIVLLRIILLWLALLCCFAFSFQFHFSISNVQFSIFDFLISISNFQFSIWGFGFGDFRTGTRPQRPTRNPAKEDSWRNPGPGHHDTAHPLLWDTVRTPTQFRVLPPD